MNGQMITLENKARQYRGEKQCIYYNLVYLVRKDKFKDKFDSSGAFQPLKNLVRNNLVETSTMVTNVAWEQRATLWVLPAANYISAVK